jgi:hypothetical protein
MDAGVVSLTNTFWENQVLVALVRLEKGSTSVWRYFPVLVALSAGKGEPSVSRVGAAGKALRPSRPRTRSGGISPLWSDRGTKNRWA